MAGFLSNFRNTMIVSAILALIMIVGYATYAPGGMDGIFWQAVFRWMHVFFGILWIGLLYYFNFVAARVTPNIPLELRPALSKHITPEALFWFRWSALATWVMGVILAYSRGYLLQALTLGFVGPAEQALNTRLLGVGMWLATIMFFNVWAFIWPAQKIALGIKDGTAEEKAAAAKKAGMFSRINTLLSLPMLTAMAMNQTIFG
jgi:uncharacterized membrane protein